MEIATDLLWSLLTKIQFRPQWLSMIPCLEEDRPIVLPEEGERRGQKDMAEVTWGDQEEDTGEEDTTLHTEISVNDQEIYVKFLKSVVIYLNLCSMKLMSTLVVTGGPASKY